MDVSSRLSSSLFPSALLSTPLDSVLALADHVVSLLGEGTFGRVVHARLRPHGSNGTGIGYAPAGTQFTSLHFHFQFECAAD